MAKDVSLLSIAELAGSYRDRSLSPVEVAEAFFERIERHDGALHAYVETTRDLALEQARQAERAYASGKADAALAGIPVAIKDAFHVAGVRTTLGSDVYRGLVAKGDSGLVRRLRAAGAVFLGKTNTAEFGQSATTDNLLGPDTATPWDLARTAGGSSGGSAAAVAARLATVAVGSDGGGSVRIPAAFSGIFGLKPSPGLCGDEHGFRGMTEFVSAGPMTRSVADARILLGVLADARFERGADTRPLRVCYCPAPENRPVDPGVAAVVERAARVFEELGHSLEEDHPPIQGWGDIFGPLVLEEEHRERGHLLKLCPERLTRYERSALEAAIALDPDDVRRARALLPEFRARLAAFFDRYDIVLTPATAVPPFPLGERPKFIRGVAVDRLWGAFPFTAPFNVGGVAAAAVPCGLAGGLPVSVQIVARAGEERLLLDAAQDLEEAVGFDRGPLDSMWT
ncbi:amidase [Castellaniella sp.]|uniref:amidase n=1 Tax=Castellaniella sp. TaxID=1955812 RepID=UPI002AFF27E6|nr:amidase [Castellaniella sp.]